MKNALVRCAWLIPFAGAVVRSGLHLPAAAVGDLVVHTLRQVRFTFGDALPLVLLIAVGASVPSLVHVVQVSDLGLAPMFGRAMVTVVLRELAPLLPALLIVVRSGSAVASELATATALGERRGLEATGVDPLQYWVLPRLLGFAVSGTLLALAFAAAALATGALLTLEAGQLEAYRTAVAGHLGGGDLVFVAVKGGVYGGVTALVCCFEGFFAGDAITGIPQATSRALLTSFLLILGSSVLLSAGQLLL